LHLFVAICHFYLQSFAEAEEAAMKGPVNQLQNRILFHIAHRRADENKLMMHHQKLTDTQEDQLCLASIHFLRSHFQEVRPTAIRASTFLSDPCMVVFAPQATDIYKRLLLENRDDLALNVYVAMCYYKVTLSDLNCPLPTPFSCDVRDVALSWITTTYPWRFWRCICNPFPPALWL
jgi:intraflagellar transport protein 56